MKVRTSVQGVLVAYGVGYIAGLVTLAAARQAGLPELGQVLLPLFVFVMTFLVLQSRLTGLSWYGWEAGERRRGKRLIATAILLLGTQVVIWIVFPIIPLEVPIMGYLVLGVVGLVAIAIDLPDYRRLDSERQAR